MPMNAHNKDEVFVGRIRRDETQPKTQICGLYRMNLRKGAATNAVQIAEYLMEAKFRFKLLNKKLLYSSPFKSTAAFFY